MIGKTLGNFVLEAQIVKGGMGAPPASTSRNKRPEEMDIRDSMIFERANPNNKETWREVDPRLSHNSRSSSQSSGLELAAFTNDFSRYCRFVGFGQKSDARLSG